MTWSICCTNQGWCYSVKRVMKIAYTPQWSELFLCVRCTKGHLYMRNNCVLKAFESIFAKSLIGCCEWWKTDVTASRATVLCCWIQGVEQQHPVLGSLYILWQFCVQSSYWDNIAIWEFHAFNMSYNFLWNIKQACWHFSIKILGITMRIIKYYEKLTSQGRWAVVWLCRKRWTGSNLK